MKHHEFNGFFLGLVSYIFKFEAVLTYVVTIKNNQNKA